MKIKIKLAFLALTLLCTGLQAVNELWEAVRENDPQKVLALLKAGANPDGDSTWAIPLDLAATFNKIEIAKILLHNPYKKANINIMNDMDDTPLKNATRFGQVDMVKFLLEHGADPNKSGLSALYAMALEGNYIDKTPTQVFQITKLLLDYGADLKAKDPYDRKTPIEKARKISILTNKPNTAFLDAVKAWEQDLILTEKAQKLEPIRRRNMFLINQRELLGKNIGFKFE